MPDSPLINRKRYQHASAEIVIELQRIIDVKSISYEDELKPGKVRGTSKRVQGRTAGIYDCTGSIEIYKGAAQQLLATLGAGFMEREFNVVIQYAATGMPLETVTLVGCRITKVSSDHSEDENGLADKMDLDIMEILRNGLPATLPEA